MKKHASSYNVLLLGSLFLGLALGACQSPVIFAFAEIISNIFLKFLRLLSLPLVFFAIGSTITSVKSLDVMLSLGRTILYYTLLTTIIAAGTGLVLFVLISPVVQNQVTAPAIGTMKASGYLDVLAKTIPGNILEPFLENNVISAAFLSGLIAFASLFLSQKEKGLVHDIFSSLFAVFLKLAKGVLRFLPLAILAFSILFYKEIVQSQGNKTVFAKYLLCVLGANLLQGFIVLPLLLKMHKLSPLAIGKSMSPALATAFFSKSSASTLPLTMELAEEKLHIKPSLSRFGFPLCSVINMNGCAAFILITVLFVAQSNGLNFSLLSMIGWIFIATIAAVGNAGVPMGCYFLTYALLSSMEVPLPLLGLILPFYTLVDMVETALNVWSDCCVVMITNKLFANKSIDIE